MSYLQAIVLGVLQGLTEFLPVSSSGHLTICQGLFGLRQDAQAMLVFDLGVHVGTLVAAAVVFRGSIVRLMANRRHLMRVLALTAVATVVTATVALLLEDKLKAVFGSPRVVAGAFFATGALLWLSERIPYRHRGWKKFGYVAAGVVGLAQAAAVTPGISRSGTTITVAMFLGLRRRWAAEFSFLISAPAILGACAITLADLKHMDLEGSTLDLGPILVGSIAAAIVGYVALRILLRMLHKAQLHWFTYYLWALAIYVWINADKLAAH